MADEADDSQKTEDPSGRKLGKARDKGQVAQSQELKNWAIMIAGTIGLMFLSPMLLRDVEAMAVPFLAHADAMSIDPGSLRQMMAEVFLKMLIAMTPVIGVIVMFAIGSNLMQFGLMWATDKIKPDAKKISPMAGIKRIFSVRQLVEFLKGLLKLGVLGTLAVMVTAPLLQNIAVMPDMDFIHTLDNLHAIAVRLALSAMGMMTVMGFLDYAFQKYKFTKQMRMTKQEVKDEHKDTEGDPQIKARIRGLRIERTRQRMMAAIGPRADVVVTNPTHFAVALEYKLETMQAPRMVAKGADHIAFRIREEAEKFDIPIIENPPLARALYASVELEQEIPPEHYVAVAEVIGFVMRMRGKIRR